MFNELLILNISWDHIRQRIRNIIIDETAESKAPRVIKIFLKKYNIVHISGNMFHNKFEIYDYYHKANSPRLVMELLEEKNNATILKVKSRLTLNHYWVIIVLSLFIISSAIAAVINYAEDQTKFREWLVITIVFLIQLSIYIYYWVISAKKLFKYFVAHLDYNIISNPS